MQSSWAKQAENVLDLFEKMMRGKSMMEGSPEHTFYEALWNLCQRVKEFEDRK